jgi:hypothetical protein
MVLIYCNQCKGAIHIKTKYRNYLPKDKINGRPYGRRLHKDNIFSNSIILLADNIVFNLILPSDVYINS